MVALFVEQYLVKYPLTGGIFPFFSIVFSWSWLYRLSLSMSFTDTQTIWADLSKLPSKELLEQQQQKDAGS